MSSLNVEKAFLTAGVSAISSSDLTSTWVAMFSTISGCPDEKSKTKLSSTSSASFAVVVVFGVVGLIVVVVVVLLLDLIILMRMSDELIFALHFIKLISISFDDIFLFRIKIKVNQILN